MGGAGLKHVPSVYSVHYSILLLGLDIEDDNLDQIITQDKSHNLSLK